MLTDWLLRETESSRETDQQINWPLMSVELKKLPSPTRELLTHWQSQTKQKNKNAQFNHLLHSIEKHQRRTRTEPLIDQINWPHMRKILWNRINPTTEFTTKFERWAFKRKQQRLCVHTQKSNRLCTHRSVSAPMCTQLLCTHKHINSLCYSTGGNCMHNQHTGLRTNVHKPVNAP